MFILLNALLAIIVTGYDEAVSGVDVTVTRVEPAARFAQASWRWLMRHLGGGHGALYLSDARLRSVLEQLSEQRAREDPHAITQRISQMDDGDAGAGAAPGPGAENGSDAAVAMNGGVIIEPADAALIGGFQLKLLDLVVDQDMLQRIFRALGAEEGSCAVLAFNVLQRLGLPTALLEAATTSAEEHEARVKKARTGAFRALF